MKPREVKVEEANIFTSGLHQCVNHPFFTSV